MGKKKMVGGVPMATIYKGMSVKRLEQLNELESTAFYQTVDELGYAHVDFYKVHAEKFDKLMERYATKAGWHANRKNKINK